MKQRERHGPPAPPGGRVPAPLLRRALLAARYAPTPSRQDRPPTVGRSTLRIVCPSLRTSLRRPDRISGITPDRVSGTRIRARRLDLGLRQSDVAKIVGAYTSTVNTWENGHFAPEVRFMPKIIEFLGYGPFGVPPTSFPGWLKAARVAAGLTRRQLAARLRIHPTTGAKWERGEARPNAGVQNRLEIERAVSADEPN